VKGARRTYLWGATAVAAEVLGCLAWRPRMLRWGATEAEAASRSPATRSPHILACGVHVPSRSMHRREGVALDRADGHEPSRPSTRRPSSASDRVWSPSRVRASRSGLDRRAGLLQLPWRPSTAQRLPPLIALARHRPAKRRSRRPEAVCASGADRLADLPSPSPPPSAAPRTDDCFADAGRSMPSP
jgi:hypothetical protein